MWFFGVGAMSSCILWLVFAQFTMRRIERQIKEAGISVGFLWDGLGGRIVFYGYAIALPERIALRIERLINVPLVRSYANQADWWRSVLFIGTSHLWIGFTLLSMLFGIQ